jgi:hypothetical protein
LYPATISGQVWLCWLGNHCELRFKIVGVETAGLEVLGRLGNLIVARAAFDVSVSLWPSSWIELRQDARVIENHGARE